MASEMRWVKFSERFPSSDDKTSVSGENEVITRGTFYDGSTYAALRNIDDCHDWGVDMSAEWLEGAFPVSPDGLGSS